MYNSKIGNILKEDSDLCNYDLKLNENILRQFELKLGLKSLSKRSINIAFTTEAKGTLIGKAKQYKEKIEEF